MENSDQISQQTYLVAKKIAFFDKSRVSIKNVFKNDRSEAEEVLRIFLMEL